MSEIKIIDIGKNSISFDGTKVDAPFQKSIMSDLFGTPRFFSNIKSSGLDLYVWDDLGIGAYYDSNIDAYVTLFISTGDIAIKIAEKIYTGKILIEGKDFIECEWVNLLGNFYRLQCGDFMLTAADGTTAKKSKDEVLRASKIDIKYIAPQPTENDIEKVKETSLRFDNFNFKLAIMQVLMYEKKLLKPTFDVYEFAEKFTKRKIELMNEGYDEPIKEVLEWFENYQIPASLADEVEEIYMDGGNDIYLQIMPNWDGEDDFYDVNQLSLEEVSQFKNLKNMTLMSSKLDDIKENLKELDINIELL